MRFQLELVNNLQQTFASRVKQLDWMSDETKTRALEKLNAFAKKIAYPDKWKDYAGVVINRNDYLGNARRASQYAYNDMITRCTHIVNMEACTRHLIFSQAIKCM